jgi:hypothetical protein
MGVDSKLDPEDRERAAAAERLHEAVQSARARGDPATARTAIRGASNAFFSELGDILRRYTRAPR